MKFQILKQSLFFSLLIAITAVFVWMIGPYLGAIFWAAVLAIVFYPVQKSLLGVMNKRKALSSVFTILSIFIIVFVPIYFLGNLIVQETVATYQRVSSDPEIISKSILKLNRVVPVKEWIERSGLSEEDLKVKVIENLESVSQFIFSRAARFGQDTLQFAANFFIMFYVLYFFLKEGPWIRKKLMHLLPLGDKREDRLFKKFSSTVRATIKGTIIIGIVQGFLGGLLFWIVGISSPVLWGALMAVLSIIPAVGSFLVWGPAGIILIFFGSFIKGILVLVIGAFVIGLVDNVLRPLLVGKDTEMPDAMILLSTLGGISAFGISGFVIGPVIAAFFLVMWEMFEKDYHQELVRDA